MNWERIIRRLPIWILLAFATWHAALAIVGLTVTTLNQTTEYVGFTADHAFWALALGWVAWVFHENDRLRNTPAWRAAADAFGKGYEQGAADATRIQETR